MELSAIQHEIERLIAGSEITNWQKAKFIFNFPPFINRGLQMTQMVPDENGKFIRLIDLDQHLMKLVEKFILHNNQDGQYNQIIFEVTNTEPEHATITAVFDEQVDQTFRKNIPKRYKGNMVPWWKNPEEIKGLD